jgi:Rieske Fe-S protein
MMVACTKGTDPNTSSNVPNVSVSLTININNAPYTTLQTVGGQAYATGGNRGIILYRASSTSIVAFDRTCTYDIGDANGIVQGQTNNTAICLECGSQYHLSDGGVASGPTTIGLKQYNASFSTATNIVTVKN